MIKCSSFLLSIYYSVVCHSISLSLVSLAAAALEDIIYIYINHRELMVREGEGGDGDDTL